MATAAKVAAATAAALALAKIYFEIQKGLAPPPVDGLEDGGTLIAKTLQQQGVDTVFCLSGGHVAPVYVAAEKLGISVIDVRHEVNSVFAADAHARVTGKPGVAIVTAGPGVTNTVTAVKNAQMAESPVVILGGCTSIVLMGRGSLQDIDHLSVMKSITKWSASPRTVKDLVPTMHKAFQKAVEGVPGPVFVELPMDLLWPAGTTVPQTVKMAPKGNSFMARVVRWYLFRHLFTIYAGVRDVKIPRAVTNPVYPAPASDVRTVVSYLKKAKRPVLVIGSQAMLNGPEDAAKLADAVAALGIPVWVSGMARGLLGATGRNVQFRHKRTDALRSADTVIFAGVVADFRMQYGFVVNHRAKFVTVNRSRAAGRINVAPTTGVVADASLFLQALAKALPQGTDAGWKEFMAECAGREAAQEANIAKNASNEPDKFLNPVHLCQELNKQLADDSVVCVDGGDFIGTAAYTLRPRQPLGWLDPGAFGTLGVGAGFAIGVKQSQPAKEVWLLYGDGACGFSLMDFDTMVRKNLGVIGVIGNDAVWAQMIRDQATLLDSECACHLNRTDYHKVVEALGGEGILVQTKAEIEPAFRKAKAIAATGKPVLVNCLISRNDFREGSISV